MDAQTTRAKAFGVRRPPIEPIHRLLLLGAAVVLVCVILFYAIRFLTYLRHPEYRSVPSVTGGQWINAILVTAGLLVLFWYVSYGNTVAVVIFITIMALAKLAAYKILSKSPKKDGNDANR
tara:strand:- start:2601 stop:2963 length:363 start_codon:yes stop_codon:yes gene_type:complete